MPIGEYRMYVQRRHNAAATRRTVPNSTMMPENNTQTGVGATACASGSQRWNGTMAAFVRNPQVMMVKAKRTRGS